MKDTIVLVDDNEELLSVYSSVLEKQGFKVLMFTKVGPAAKYLQQNDISNVLAIVSDIMMGPIDGLDFISFIKSIPALAKIDFYFMTGAMPSVTESLYRTYNIKKIMQKPFRIKELVDALKETQIA